MIGVWKEVAFQTRCLGIQIGYQPHLFPCRIQKVLTGTNAGQFQAGGDVKDARALGNNDRPGIDVPALNPRGDFSRRGRVIEAVLPCLQRAALDGKVLHDGARTGQCALDIDDNRSGACGRPPAGA